MTAFSEELSDERLAEMLDFADRTGAEEVMTPVHALRELQSLRSGNGGEVRDDVDSLRILRQFADQYRSGAAGAEMDCDAAMALALSIDDVLSALGIKP